VLTSNVCSQLLALTICTIGNAVQTVLLDPVNTDFGGESLGGESPDVRMKEENQDGKKELYAGTC
jgi:hypothetical protein